MSLSITHSHAEGTIFNGDPRPNQKILKDAKFRWSRNMVAWYVPRSRDTDPEMWRIDQVVKAFAAIGETVTVEINNERRPTAVIEAEREERTADRSAALEAKATRLAATSTALQDESRELADMIPLGQPILVGHHSEGKHRNHIAKVQSKMDKAVATGKDARETARRAVSAVLTQEQRKSAATTVRRIEKFEADARHIDKHWPGSDAKTARLAELAEKVAHWKAHLDEIGYVPLTKADVAAGQIVLVRGRPVQLQKVNAKTVVVESHGLTLSYGYEDVALIPEPADTTEVPADA